MNQNKSHRSTVMTWLFAVDQILRGEATPLATGEHREIKFPLIGVSIVVIAMAVAYGFCMGAFSLIHGAEIGEYSRALLQTFASMIKVPMLYVLTLSITFPSLYVFNALIGSRLQVGPVLKLLVASLAVNLAVLVSMGPILAFFSASTPNYSFIVLLNIGIFSIAGALGLTFLVQTLNRLAATTARQFDHSSQANATSSSFRPTSSSPSTSKTPTITSEDSGTEMLLGTEQSPVLASEVPSAIESPVGMQLNRHVKKVFFCWVTVFGLVGAQMGWVLRPFIGSPNLPFQFFRARESNFFEAASSSFWNLFS